MNTEELEKKLEAVFDGLENDPLAVIAFTLLLSGRDLGKETYDLVLADEDAVKQLTDAGGWKALKKRLDQLAFDACKLRDYVAEKRLP